MLYIFSLFLFFLETWKWHFAPFFSEPQKEKQLNDRHAHRQSHSFHSFKQIITANHQFKHGIQSNSTNHLLASNCLIIFPIFFVYLISRIYFVVLLTTPHLTAILTLVSTVSFPLQLVLSSLHSCQRVSCCNQTKPFHFVRLRSRFSAYSLFVGSSYK